MEPPRAKSHMARLEEINIIETPGVLHARNNSCSLQSPEVEMWNLVH
jgi:hypothetical protein